MLKDVNFRESENEPDMSIYTAEGARKRERER
jgi:hypothetical protein